MKSALRIFFLLICLASTLPAAPGLPEAKRIVFLGDSITHAGQYIEYVETVLITNTNKQYEFLDLGLSSETVSGLSENGHAGGKFPRPDLHERLDRVIAKTKPDLIIACYGMNCGIYLPLDNERFQKYKDGIQWLRDKAKAAGANIIHLTPPTFDSGADQKRTPYYNDVLGAYSKWLLDQRAQGWQVIDIHDPMDAALAAKRKTDASFAYAKDGVHPTAEGHWVMAQEILRAWGVTHDYKLEDFTTPTGRLNALHALVAKRLHVLSASYLSEAGHKRPGIKSGLPMEMAQAQAAELTAQIKIDLEKAKSGQ